MKHGSKRVLAYLLSKPIDEHQLANIAGGQAQVSCRQTLHASGNSYQGPDVVYDVATDM